jgi:hypothetical protein
LRLRISGPAGTGKSTVLKCIFRLATEMFIPDANTGECGTIVVVAAWSGIAAYNCGGSTLSGIFNTRSSSMQRITEKLKGGVKLVIMDEDSNATLHVLGTMDQQLRIANDTDIPFGGAHLILAGDMCQLKAVKAVAMFQKPPNNTNPKSAEFYARLFGRTRYMEITDYIELTKNFRQQESMIYDAGQSSREMSPNTETPADINLLNTRYEPDMQKALLEIQNKKQAICLALMNLNLMNLNLMDRSVKGSTINCNNLYPLGELHVSGMRYRVLLGFGNLSLFFRDNLQKNRSLTSIYRIVTVTNVLDEECSSNTQLQHNTSLFHFCTTFTFFRIFKHLTQSTNMSTDPNVAS